MRDKVKQDKTISGQDLREMFAAATNWLEKSASDIDALNVFPVPDGDTGTNMLLTMRSSVEEAYQAIGILNGKLSAAGNESSGVINELLGRIDLTEAGIITIYYGADTEEAKAEDVSARISKQHPQLQVEIINGGQPHYDYIIGIE